jgi:hypothetical protein
MLYVADTDKGYVLIEANRKSKVIPYLRRSYGTSMIIKEVSRDETKIAWAKGFHAMVHKA